MNDEAKDENEMVDLTKLDLTVQTITVGSEDNPVATIMKGHVDGKTFDKAWKQEGWDGSLSEEPTEKEVKDFEEGLSFDYAKINEGGKTLSWGQTKGEAGVFPCTVSGW